MHTYVHTNPSMLCYKWSGVGVAVLWLEIVQGLLGSRAARAFQATLFHAHMKTLLLLLPCGVNSE